MSEKNTKQHGVQDHSNEAHNSLNDNSEKGVKKFVLVLTKQHKKFLNELLTYINEHVNATLPFSVAIMNNNPSCITLSESLQLTDDLTKCFALFHASIKLWKNNKGDDIKVRWALHHRARIAFLLSEFANFQSQEVYRRLMDKEEIS